MMKKPKTKRVKSKQIEGWISEGRAVLRNDLRPEDMVGWSDYYVLDGEGLLIRDTFEGRSAILYEKYAEYLIFDQKNQERMVRLQGYSTHSNASFPGYIQVTVKEFESLVKTSPDLLSKEFSIPQEKLDHSMASLEELGKVVKKLLKTYDARDFEEKYAVPISAYCGEVMRREIDGEWQINGDEKGRLIQILVVEKGNPAYSYRPEIPLALILSGDAPHGSNLQVELSAQLHKYGFIKGNEAHYGIK